MKCVIEWKSTQFNDIRRMVSLSLIQIGSTARLSNRLFYKLYKESNFYEFSAKQSQYDDENAVTGDRICRYFDRHIPQVALL